MNKITVQLIFSFIKTQFYRFFVVQVRLQNNSSAIKQKRIVFCLWDGCVPNWKTSGFKRTCLFRCVTHSAKKKQSPNS